MVAAADPMMALMKFNWFPSAAAGTFRSDTIKSHFFEDMPKYFEWTYLALKLTMLRKVHFVDTPTYRLYHGSPGSLSASTPYLLSEPAALRAMLDLKPPPRIARALRRKISSSYHDISEHFLRDGDIHAAASYHVKSMMTGNGLKYLPYTHHLVRRAVAAKWTPAA
jgi:hypothetical protein